MGVSWSEGREVYSYGSRLVQEIKWYTIVHQCTMFTVLVVPAKVTVAVHMELNLAGSGNPQKYKGESSETYSNQIAYSELTNTSFNVYVYLEILATDYPTQVVDTLSSFQHRQDELITQFHYR